MDTKFNVKIILPFKSNRNNSNKELFYKSFLPFRYNNSHVFVFEDMKEVKRAKLFLTTNEFDFRVDFEINLKIEDILKFEGYIITTPSEKDEEGGNILYDSESNVYVFSDVVRSILKKNNNSKNEKIIQKLTKGIEISVAHEIIEDIYNEDKFIVISDGRYYLSREDKKLLLEHNILESSKILFNSKYYFLTSKVLTISSKLAFDLCVKELINLKDLIPVLNKKSILSEL